MSIKHLILRNLKKNMKNYFLYVFALIFSVALYFSFVTLQYAPDMDSVKGTIKGASAIKAASIILVVIVAVFLLYANTIFIKRRSKEIGLFQLIGMTKNRIFGILSAENLILYFSSLSIGIFMGFSISKLIMMILFKITGVKAIATLHFSSKAFIQTIVVFCFIYIFILIMNYLFIRAQSILSLFRVVSSTEAKMKKLSLLDMIIGIIGVLLIIVGYFISTKLFSGDKNQKELFSTMITILVVVIIGTYLFYKGSVSIIFNAIRKKKNGYLTINEVLSLSSIMFRMKSNALLLTIITTVSALAIGLLSLGYISYYSAEKSAANSVAADFAFTNIQDAKQFKDRLDSKNIPYKEKEVHVLQANANMEQLLDPIIKDLDNMDPQKVPLSVVSDKEVKDIHLAPNEILLTGYNDLFMKFMEVKPSAKIKLRGKKDEFSFHYLGLKKKYILSWNFTNGNLPVAVINDSVYKRLEKDKNPKIQHESSIYMGFDIKDQANLEKANDVFKGIKFDPQHVTNSRLEISRYQKMLMGLYMFIVGFLGLTFLITSGCILYFKQMDESEDEKLNYTILRKLGFTQLDLLKGIQAKQIFNFGIPLIIGLSHSYFAVQSGWFFFGTELWTPMFIVMVIYTILYSIFGFLSVLYYKKVIKEAL